MQRFPCFWSALACVVMCSASSAVGHEMTIHAHVHGTEIHGDVIDGGGIAMGGMKVTAYSPSGETLGETTTDDRGQFTLVATQICDWRIVASGGGHRADCIVRAEELPPDLSEAESAGHSHSHGEAGHAHDDPGADVSELLRQVTALRRDLQSLQEKRRWQDVIGGVGYILGLMGLAFYFLGARQRERFPSKSDG